MMVPAQRLLFAVAFIVTPLMAVGGVRPDLLAPCAIAIAVLLFVALLDAAFVYGGLSGVSAELPDVVRMTKGREASVVVTLRRAHGLGRSLRVGLRFPREIVSPQDTVDAVLTGDGGVARFAWECTPTRRGRYFLRNVYVEGPSPLGLWSVRRTLPVESELRVYPNLDNERKQLSALFLNRGAFGVHAHRQVGQGREFEKLREYVPGDSYSDIHWKATARRGRPVTKTYQIERTQEVYVVIDTSRLSARTVETGLERDEGTTVTQLERFLSAALILGLAAERQGDLFGLIVFDDSVRRFVRAKNGKAHYTTCRDAIYTLEPRVVNPDYGELCSFIRTRLRRRALLIVLTNLDDPVLSENFVQHSALLHPHHLVLVNMITPPDVKPLFSDEDAATGVDVYRRLAGHMLWHDLREIERTLSHRGVKFSLLEREGMAAQLVTQYINVKQRQLL